jgi:hypothetical protein
MALPAGYYVEGGEIATLRDVLSPDVPTVDGDQLTEANRTELALLRVEAQPNLQLAVRGLVLDRGRALEEIRNGSPLGLILVKVEHRAIELLRQNAEAQRRRRRAARHGSKMTSRKRRRPRG